MTKVEFISRITQELKENDVKVTKDLVAHFLNAQESVIYEAVQNEEKIVIPNVVKIETKLQSARTGRNPKTGELVDVPEKTRVVVKPVNSLKKVFEV